jgi:SAM-dependent methyltransferase
VNATTPPPLPTEASNAPLTFTGERFHPDRAGEMWFEHWHRYHAVTPVVAGKRVLDIASGEGYGSAQLASVAAIVTGVDVSPSAISHATAQYGAVSNLRFVQGSCEAIPLAAASVDVVVSFETLEHIAEHEAFLREIKRVLTPDGLLIISTPNKAEYTDARGYQNEFHVKELYLAEFEALLATNFAYTKLFGQRNGFHSLIQPLSNTNNQTGALNIGSMPARAGYNPAPLYVIAFASNNQALIDSPATALPVSAFTAKEDNQVDIFMQIWRHSQHLEGRVAELTAQNQTHEDTITKLANELNQLRANAQNLQASAPANTSNESTIERFIKRLSK